MNLQVSRKCDYALRTAIRLARADGAAVSLAEIASSQMVPPAFLEKVIATLVGAGLVTSQRGPGGGYRLARPAAEVTLLDVILAAEGSLGLNQCVLGEGSCERQDVCGAHHVWRIAQQQLQALFAETTMADLARVESARLAGAGRA